MKLIAIMVFISFFCSNLFSNDSDEYNKVTILGNNSIQYVFDKIVNIREKPNLTSKVICQAMIGDKIRIIERVDLTLDLYGVSAHWYKVDFNKNIGYLWGGLLSTIAIECDFNNDKKTEILLDRCLTNRYTWFSAYMQSYLHEYKLCYRGELISTNPFKIKPLDPNSKFEILENKGFKPEVKILLINSSGGDGPNGFSNNELYYLHDNNFILITKFDESWDEGTHVSYDIKYPLNSGFENIMTIIRTEKKYDEKGIPISNSSTEIQKIKWHDNLFEVIEY